MVGFGGAEGVGFGIGFSLSQFHKSFKAFISLRNGFSGSSELGDSAYCHDT
jgi:hypothetical protein